MKYIAHTIQGIEEIAAKELKGMKILDKRIILNRKIPPKNPRTINIIYSLIKKFKFNNIEEIKKEIEKINFKIKEPFKVECLREGQHDFKSVDIEKFAYYIITKKGCKLDYKNPSTTIFIDIFNDDCFLGYLIKDRICKRPYRVKINNQSINACLASSMIILSEPKKNELYLDPFCKDGVIPIEASHFKIKKIFALDQNKNSIRNAIINSKMAKLPKSKIEFKNLNIEWLETLFKKNSVDKIITNLFISKHDLEINKTIKEFFHQSSYILKKFIILITNKPEQVIENSKLYFNLTKEISIKIGEMHYKILKFEKKENN